MIMKQKPGAKHPERVLQFGEGNFLRGFVDWMIHRMNQQGLYDGQAVVIQPIAEGLSDQINAQSGMYTLLLRGMLQGKMVDEADLITSIRRAINPYHDYKAFLHCALNPDLRIIVSNTTESGIAYDPKNQYYDAPPASFPGKLTVFLHKRFKAFQGDPAKAFIILPCELIERNGEQLKQIIVRYANQWGLGEDFIAWLDHNHFLNTLVDRIVTGYPKEEMKQLTARFGYVDHLFNTAEPFHLWVIEGDTRLAEEFPLTQAGLNVIWTDNMTPYRTRKVRILNGAHTMTVLAAYLAGKDTVKECMDDKCISAFMNKGLFEEIIPTLDLPRDELESYANAVIERFANPFIHHHLLSIALNSVSKFKTRVLPSLLEYKQRTGNLPPILCFSLAALILFYREARFENGVHYGERNGGSYKIQDDAPHLERFREIWSDCDNSPAALRRVAKQVLAHEPFWGVDLDATEGLSERIADALALMLAEGITEAMKQTIRE
ncbi:tagaturonate reductase [Paenibacillus sp. y28]